MDNSSGRSLREPSLQCSCEERVYAAFFDIPVNVCASEEGRVLQVAEFEPTALQVRLECGNCERPFHPGDSDARATLVLYTEAVRNDVAELLPAFRQLPLLKSRSDDVWAPHPYPGT